MMEDYHTSVAGMHRVYMAQAVWSLYGYPWPSLIRLLHYIHVIDKTVHDLPSMSHGGISIWGLAFI